MGTTGIFCFLLVCLCAFLLPSGSLLQDRPRSIEAHDVFPGLMPAVYFTIDCMPKTRWQIHDRRVAALLPVNKEK